MIFSAHRFLRPVVCWVLVFGAVGRVDAQFLEGFDDRQLRMDPSGVEGWSYFAGDGEVAMEFASTGEGFASITVDATHDRHNVWWALIKRKVSDDLDLQRLNQPGWELRVEARIRTSHAPRRVNLHVNTQRTTDFHSHLMEFDIPDAGSWHTISMTTREFPVERDDTVFAQMALMDWGLDRYRVDVDYFKVDVVQAGRAGPDLGAQVPYHPSVPDVGTFEHALPVAESAVVDLANPGVNLGEWSVLDGSERPRVLTVGGTMWVILRWDLGELAGKEVAGHGLLEVTTHSVLRTGQEIRNFGLVRVVEIQGGDPEWRRDSVTVDSLARGGALDEVFNPQMIIDWPVSETAGARTWFTISRPVLQRLIDGRTMGIALTPLGSINASLSTGGCDEPRLLFNIDE